MPKKSKDDIFNPAFKDLQAKIEKRRKKKKPASLPRPGEKAPEEKGPEEREIDTADTEVFHEAMAGVTPLPRRRRRIAHNPENGVRPSHPPPDDEREALTRLHDLVRGAVEMDITFSDEYMEGSVKGFSRRLMKKLKRGEFPFKDHIDLHGMTKKEAEEHVRAFLLQSHRVGHRCVLIVHGRGLNSPDSFPVLKEGLPVWLSRGPIRKIVLAFATARPYDGGTGAIYVLLRKR